MGKKGWDVPSDMSQDMEENEKPIAPTSPVVDDALPPPHLKTNDRYAKNKEEEDEDDGAYTDDDFEEATPKVQRDMSSQENNANKSKPKKGGTKKKIMKQQNLFEKKRTSHVTTATTKAFENKTPKEKKLRKGTRPQIDKNK